jgi:hypothetical protein
MKSDGIPSSREAGETSRGPGKDAGGNDTASREVRGQLEGANGPTGSGNGSGNMERGTMIASGGGGPVDAPHQEEHPDKQIGGASRETQAKLDAAREKAIAEAEARYQAFIVKMKALALA